MAHAATAPAVRPASRLAAREAGGRAGRPRAQLPLQLLRTFQAGVSVMVGGPCSSTGGLSEQPTDSHRRQRRAGAPCAVLRHLSAAEPVLPADPATPLDNKLKIIGVGNRGSSAVARLVAHGRVAGAELWCLDADAKALQASGVPNTVLIPKEGSELGGAAAALEPADMARIVGQGAADKDGRGNVNVGDGGVAFVIASAGNVPGGSDVVVGLARELRASGHFTAVAVTRPFEFEGARKAQAAERLIAVLEEVAHLVVVVEQDVLSKAFNGSQMTVAEATLIADNALEHTVRSILSALRASEILKSTRGALAWHGRDLRRYKRLLSPPLQRLLTCPGTAALGRGVASMPAEAAHRMGAQAALMHLASDAVRAAAESPFLEGHLARPSAILAAISLPSPKQRFAGADGQMIEMHSLRDYDAERALARMAVQAAAGALMSVTSNMCDDVVMCAAPREGITDQSQEEASGRSVRVEVSLLVLSSSTVVAPAPAGQRPPAQRPPPPPIAARAAPGPAVARPAAAAGSAVRASTAAPAQRSAAPAQRSAAPALSQAQPVSRGNGRAPAQGRAQAPSRLPSSSWTAMSALAGGTVQSIPRPAPPQQPDALPAVSPVTAAPLQTQTARPSPAVREEGEAVPAPALDVGQLLAEALTAQSLDLPPQAAQWRQTQRGKVVRPLIVEEAAEWEGEEEEGEGDGSGAGGLLGAWLGGRARQQVDIRERTFGILEVDRSIGE